LAGAEIEKALALAIAKQEQLKALTTTNTESAISFGSFTAISSKDSSLENQTA
jgi:hypothetical protein